MKRGLIIFAKEPYKGRVKTRLRAILSDAQCLELYKAFLKDTMSLSRAISGVVKILAYQSDDNSEPVYLKQVFSGYRFYRQSGIDLGQRLYNAFKFARQCGLDKIVIIGSDAPNLPVEYIQDAFYRLDTVDLVIGPSDDGGYYLIGLKEPYQDLFDGINWSSDSVFADTVEKCRQINKEISVLKKWYDVDLAQDLSRLRDDLLIKQDKIRAIWTKRVLQDGL